MPAYTPYQEGNQIGAGGNHTFTFPETMGSFSILNSGPGEISFAINGAVPANTNRGANKTRLNANQSFSKGDLTVTTVAVLAGAAGAGVEVCASPIGSEGLA